MVETLQLVSSRSNAYCKDFYSRGKFICAIKKEVYYKWTMSLPSLRYVTELEYNYKMTIISNSKCVSLLM